MIEATAEPASKNHSRTFDGNVYKIFAPDAGEEQFADLVERRRGTACPGARRRTRWPARPGGFPDRTEAGRRLGERLKLLGLVAPVVLGVARGGVEVAAPVAARLRAPLDVLVVREGRSRPARRSWGSARSRHPAWKPPIGKLMRAVNFWLKVCPAS